MFDLASYLPYLMSRAGARLAEAFGAELVPDCGSVLNLDPCRQRRNSLSDG